MAAERARERRGSALPPNLAPRGVSREEAAAYIGISPTKFDELVESGSMPPPKHIGTRRIWDVRALDSAFDRLPEAQFLPNPWDEV